MSDKTEFQNWIKRRTDAVRQVYSAYDALVEFGNSEMLVDQDTPVQVSCPFHGPDKRPSARYYPASGFQSDYLRCYYCKENWDSLNLYMKFRNTPFMEALRSLERRYRIKVPRKPEGSPIEEPKDKSSAKYESSAWSDVPRYIDILEKKLKRIRYKTSLIDYVKFCRVLDHVQWDFDKRKGESTDEMIDALHELRKRMDNVPELSAINADNLISN